MHRPVLTERDILRNLQAIISDADTTPPSEVAKGAVGVLTTENRKHWAALRRTLQSTKKNAESLDVIDHALFIVCLDDASPEDVAQLCENFLCGTYQLTGGVQTGSSVNRWYDKVRIGNIGLTHSGSVNLTDITFLIVTNHRLCQWCCWDQLRAYGRRR